MILFVVIRLTLICCGLGCDPVHCNDLALYNLIRSYLTVLNLMIRDCLFDSRGIVINWTLSLYVSIKGSGEAGLNIKDGPSIPLCPCDKYQVLRSRVIQFMKWDFSHVHTAQTCLSHTKYRANFKLISQLDSCTCMYRYDN